MFGLQLDALRVVVHIFMLACRLEGTRVQTRFHSDKGMDASCNMMTGHKRALSEENRRSMCYVICSNAQCFVAPAVTTWKHDVSNSM